MEIKGKNFLRWFLDKIIGFIIKCGYDATLLDSIVRTFDKCSKTYLRYKLYPKQIDDFCESDSFSAMKPGEFAIILQGPVEKKDDFTRNTILLYKKLYPNAIIIVSTWDNTSQSVINDFESLGCDIIINKQFEGSGFGNVNYQICTSLAGVKRAKDLGAKYTLKSRTDFRLYKNYGLEYLKSLLMTYPINDTMDIPLNKRIIGLEGWRGTRYYPYWIQDYLYFGETKDIENLFTINYDKRTPSDCEKLTNKNGSLNFKNGKEYCETMPPELFIMESFLSKYIELDGTMKQYWDIVKDYFIILCFEDLEVLWKKYVFTNSMSLWSCTYDGERLMKEEERSHSFQFFNSLYQGMVKYDERAEKMREKIKYDIG